MHATLIHWHKPTESTPPVDTPMLLVYGSICLTGYLCGMTGSWRSDGDLKYPPPDWYGIPELPK